jgi:uncharacterized MAPEG superfamily protein
MSSLLSTLGLRAPTANYGPAILGFNFFFAYGLLSSRTLKQFYGLDHNESPREDLAKYGDIAVRDGKITAAQLRMLRRNEAAHANAVENFTLLVASVLFASHAGVEAATINRAALSYTAARFCHAAVYILIEHRQWSQLRGLSWWWGNLSCFFMLWKAGKMLSA